MIRFDVGVFTDCGTYKTINEDSYHLLGRSTPDNKRSRLYGLGTTKREFGVAAVFDGMGGARYGELASGVAAKLLTDYVERIMNFGREGVTEFVADANAKVCQKAHELRAPMGSTMVLIVVSDERATVYNIGDSRAYLVRSGQMKQITRDHTVAASLNSIGINSGNERRAHQLTQHLGIPPNEVVIQAFSLGSFELRASDKILLCSDGVTEGLSDAQILEVLSQEKTATELARELTTGAEQNGSKDNVTAMVFTFSDDGKPAKRYNSVAKSRVAETKRRDNNPQPQKANPANPVTSAGTIVTGRPSRDRFGILWGVCVLLALLLGLVTGVVYGLLTR